MWMRDFYHLEASGKVIWAHLSVILKGKSVSICFDWSLLHGSWSSRAYFTILSHWVVSSVLFWAPTLS